MINKIVCIGDPHITNNTEDFDKVLGLVEQLSPDLIVILGDLFHTHSLIKAEILHYWIDTIHKLSSKYKLAILRGNHDAPYDKVSYQKIGPIAILNQVIKHENVIIANTPQILIDHNINLLFVPFVYTEQDLKNLIKPFIEQNIKFDFIFTHQTFTGGVYENGFYAPDALDTAILTALLKPNGKIISGHLHTRQELSDVIYVGTPLWLNRSDLLQEKYILEILMAGDSYQFIWHNTSQVVKRPIFITIKSIDEAKKIVEEMQYNNINLNSESDIIYFTINAKESEIALIKKYLLQHFPNAKIKVEIIRDKEYQLLYKKQSFYEWLKEQVSPQEYNLLMATIKELGIEI